MFRSCQYLCIVYAQAAADITGLLRGLGEGSLSSDFKHMGPSFTWLYNFHC